MAYTITAIQDNTRGLALRVQTKNRLSLEEDAWRLESLEEKFRRCFPIRERIEWSLSQQNRVLLGRHFQVIKNMAPQKLHILHVHNYTMLHRIGQLEHALIFLDGISHIHIL